MNLKYLTNFTHNDNNFSFSLSKDIPFFDGHFPDQAILPAVVYIEICLKLLEEKGIVISDYEVVKSKFLEPLAPDSKVEVELTTEQSPYKFIWRHNDNIVAKVNIKS